LAGQRNVVEADDGQVTRHVQGPVGSHGEGGDRQSVRGREHAVGPGSCIQAGQQASVAVLGCTGGFEHFGIVSGDLVHVAADAIGHGGLRTRTAQVHDSTPANLEEVASRQPGAETVVDAHVRPLDVRRGATDQNHRQVPAMQHLQLDGIQAGGS
jgi:hypothetical protein